LWFGLGRERVERRLPALLARRLEAGVDAQAAVGADLVRVRARVRVVYGEG